MTTDAAPSGTPGAPVVVDARGLRCPLPVIRAAEASRSSAPGTVLAVRWTDPAAGYDLPAWARMRGHVVVGTEPDEDGDAAPERSADGPGRGWITTIRLG